MAIYKSVYYYQLFHGLADHVLTDLARRRRWKKQLLVTRLPGLYLGPEPLEFGGVVKSYVLPVLWMTSCLPTMQRRRQVNH